MRPSSTLPTTWSRALRPTPVDGWPCSSVPFYGEFAAGPRERDFSLRQLDLPDERRGGRRREAGAREEEPGERRRELAGAGKQLLGGRSALEPERREPRRQIEIRVPCVHEVPVDQHGASVRETEVVAAHVEMEQRVSRDASRLRRRPQRWERTVEPLRGAEAQGEERLCVGSDVPPAAE